MSFLKKKLFLQLLHLAKQIANGPIKTLQSFQNWVEDSFKKSLFRYFKQKYDSLITTNDYMTTCCLFMTVVTEAYAYIRGKFGILMNEGNNVVLLLYMHVL